MEKPKIRFGKFNNKWKKNKLDKVVDFFDNQRIPIDSGERKAGPYPYYGASGIIDFVDGYIFNGEYVLLAEDGANIILRSSPIAYLTKGKFWLNNHAHIMKMKTGSNEFLIQLLEKQNYEKYNTGTAQPKLNGEVVKKITLHFPSDEEQSAIGSLFRNLDELLASYKDNLANYQSLKATMLSKMFPKAGQTVPEIRLDGFDGEWGKYYLGDIFEQVSNYIEPSVENELWSLTVEKGLTPKTDRYKRDFLVKKNDKFKKVDVNEFVYNPMNLTLGALDLNDNEVTISVSGYYVVIKNRDIEKFDNDFLKILLKTTYAIYQYKQFATGTLIEKQRVQFPTFSEIPFYLPPIAEQQAIGSYFSNLDNLINSHQEKISQLETLKKKLLQDMFI